MVKKGEHALYYFQPQREPRDIIFSGERFDVGNVLGLVFFLFFFSPLCWVLDEKMNSAVMALHYAQSRSFSGRLATAGND